MKTLREHISEARNNGIALAHFNVSNIEMVNALVRLSQEMKTPIVIGTSEGERDYICVDNFISIIRNAQSKGVSVFSNADHTYSYERVVEAIDAGYDMVVYDGAKESLEDNIRIAKECVSYARAQKRDILVEGEMGYIGSSSKLLDEIPEGAQITDDSLTTVNDAVRFVQETGVDLFAPAVGNLHGMLKGGQNPNLNIDRIREIAQETNVPLVLHGGSGLSDEDFVSAIEGGMHMVHISTELRKAYTDGLRAELNEKPDEVAPYKYTQKAISGFEQVSKRRIELFSTKKA